MKYYYNSEAAENLQDQVLKMLPEDAKVIDTADWSDEKKKEFYHETLVPLSTQTKKALKGRVKTHKAGTIHFTDGVLVTGDNFYVGEAAFEPLGIPFEKCRCIREAGVTFVKESSIETVIEKYNINEGEAQDRIKWYILAVTDTPTEVRLEAANRAEGFYVRPLLDDSVEEIPQTTPSARKTEDGEHLPQEYIREYTGAVMREFNPDSVNLNEEAIDAVRTEAEEYENYGLGPFRVFNKHLDKMSKIRNHFQGENQMMKTSQNPVTAMETIKNPFATMGSAQLASEMMEKQDISTTMDSLQKMMWKQDISTAIDSLRMSSSLAEPPISDIVSPSEISVKSGHKSGARESGGPSREELERQVEGLQQRVAKLEKQVED